MKSLTTTIVSELGPKEKKALLFMTMRDTESASVEEQRDFVSYFGASNSTKARGLKIGLSLKLTSILSMNQSKVESMLFRLQRRDILKTECMQGFVTSGKLTALGRSVVREIKREMVAEGIDSLKGSSIGQI